MEAIRRRTPCNLGKDVIKTAHSHVLNGSGGYAIIGNGTYPSPVDGRRLVDGLPVEYLGDSDSELRRGHPGRVTDPQPEDVFVEWVGLEDQPVSRWISFDLPGLGELDEATFALRAERVRVGLPPLNE